METLEKNENQIDILTTTDTKSDEEIIENINEPTNYLNQNIKINDDIEIIDSIEENYPIIEINDEEIIENVDDSSRDEVIENVDDSSQDELIENINDSNQDEVIENADDSSQDEVNNNSDSLNILNKYGENFSTKVYLTNPAIGRDKEIKDLIVTLLTPEKSAILVGKPGIGKTAIVEGLGYRIKNENVPDALKGYTIFKLNTASLTGTMPGTNELKIQFIVDQLKNLDKIMVFIDEIHTLIGNGENTLDFANIFKPLIDRGTIKLIGATTSDEYDRYILRDKAFVRRFQKIEVSEPTREMAIQIMMGTYPKFEKKMGLTLKYSDFIKENIMAFIVDATSEFNRVYETSVRYPDISLTILQQAFSYAAFDNRKEVNIRDIRKAIQTTKLIYPDVVKKELIRFNTVFKDVYLMETKQILKDEI